jgi:uncharacterized protein YdhG (YjbR/CyaY superfamily)
MTSADIDTYLASLDPTRRAALQVLRRTILEIVPTAEETISYSVPGFRVDGVMVAGFAAWERHLAYYPHSGEVLPSLAATAPHLLDGLTWSKGTLQFPIDQPLPRALVEALIATRRASSAPGKPL